MKGKTLLITSFLLAGSQLLFAQESSNYSLPNKKDFDKWSVGLTGGLNWFQGDLNDHTKDNNSILKNIHDPVFGLKVGYQLTHSVQLNVRGNYTTLSGQKDKTTFSYPNPVTDLTELPEILNLNLLFYRVVLTSITLSVTSVSCNATNVFTSMVKSELELFSLHLPLQIWTMEQSM